jgi:hypothetical protein
VHFEWRRRVQIVSVILVLALHLLDRHERGIGHHFPTVVLDEHVLQILGVPAELRQGLDKDLEEPAEEDEPLLPGTAYDDG